MASRPAPRPMSKPMRALCALIAVVMVCALGMVATNYWTGDDESDAAATADADTTTDDGGDTGTDDDGSWAGLRAAGIPVPGDWSKQEAAEVTWEDGAPVFGDGTVELDGSYGPIDTALATVDALLDPSGDDDEWAERVLSLLSADGGGVEHPLSDAPRWWWTQRRFDADGVCSRQSGDNYLSASYEGGCSTDGEWELDDQAAVKSNPYYQSDASFPVPDGLTVSSTVNPQTVAARAYDTVLIPMDDGNWHVTVYCPATLDSPVVDADGVEIDTSTLSDGDTAYAWDLPTGFGTADRPCVTVEVTVGGQKPFWAAS